MSKRIVIIGGGESGAGAAVLAKRKGYDVFLSDGGKIKPKYLKWLQEYDVAYEEGHHSFEKILNAEEVIKSPGIADKTEVIQKIKEKNISIVGEIEFAARYTNAKLIGITGTNGKTTTTLLTHHILKKAGLNVGLAGNVGESFAYQVATENFDHYVIEISSFQLDGMHKTRINICILTNITPDHLDRYNYNVDEYIKSKFRITQNQTEEDAFIYCGDDELTLKNISSIKGKGKKFPVTLKNQPSDYGAWIANQQINITTNSNQFTMMLHELALQGKHNHYNTLMAGAVARMIEIRNETIRESMMDFRNAEHRMETVATFNGIEFINDSKATNINSTWYALECMKTDVVLILGGIDKGNDYSMLFDLAKEKVKAIVCLGTDNSKIVKAFTGVVKEIIETTSMNEAVAASLKLGKKGSVVLLSPACASFDLFENYEDRGRQFKQAVKAL